MASKTSRRALLLVTFSVLFALAAADALDQVKETTAHTFDTIKDKISLGAEEIQNVLRISAQKEADSQKSSAFTTKLFAILFPSSKPAVNALLATAYISGPPNFILALCPPNIDPSSLSIMVAFAVGGLLGDTFFHLLPEIFLGEDESQTKVRLVLLEPNRNLLLGVFIFVGLATFMAMDKALRIATGGAHSHSHGKEGSLETQAQTIDKTDYRLQDNLQALAKKESPKEQRERLYNKPYNDTSIDGKKTRDIIKDLAATNEGIRKRKSTTTTTSSDDADQSPRPDDADNMLEKVNSDSNPLTQARPQTPDNNNNSATESESKQPSTSIKLAGLLNLVADFTHNITDGLALSTSFYSSPTLGATTTMAVFFHEIPHEVGDFALLIQSGFSKRSAMGAQFVTAVGAFLGTIIGILVQEYGSGDSSGVLEGTGIVAPTGLLGTSLQWSDMLLPFTAGTFLYVGTVGVIPELLENEKGNNRVQELKRTVSQFMAMAFGALIMVAISWN